MATLDVESRNAWLLVAAMSEVLDAMGIGWAVVGGVAANLYRKATRATGDVDFLVSCDTDGLEALAKALQGRGWSVLDDLHADWLLRMLHPRLGPADLMAVGTEYQRVAMDRAVAHSDDSGASCRVLAIEDVIIHKLIADRGKDEFDVMSILETDPELDMHYLSRWLKEWDVEHRFGRVRAKLANRRDLEAHEVRRASQRRGLVA